MDPTWLASLFGPNALNSAALSGGNLGPPGADTMNNVLPFVAPPGTPQAAPPLVPSGAPMALGAAVNPPAMPLAVGPKPEAKQEDRLLEALRGIKAPEPPAYQKVATPHPPPTPTQVHPSQLINLLSSLGISPAMLPRLGGIGGRGV